MNLWILTIFFFFSEDRASLVASGNQTTALRFSGGMDAWSMLDFPDALPSLNLKFSAPVSPADGGPARFPSSPQVNDVTDVTDSEASKVVKQKQVRFLHVFTIECYEINSNLL